MASSPPGDGWLPSGWTWADVGHGALDLAGLVPVLGEPADLANAAWSAAEGNYLEAGLSLVSMIPIVGDAIGKGGKALKKLGGPALDLLRKIDFGKYLQRFADHPKLGKYVKPIQEALEKWRRDVLGVDAPGCTPGGKATCPLAGKSVGNLAEDIARLPPAAARDLLAKLPEGTRFHVLKELVTNPKLLDVATARDAAVFYSGRIRTSDGFISARSLAENLWSSGKTTLEATAGGRFLDKLQIYKGLLSERQADEIWTLLSRRYADGASGIVTVFMGDMRPGAVLPHELELLARKKAAGIIKDIRIIELDEMFRRLGK